MTEPSTPPPSDELPIDQRPGRELVPGIVTPWRELPENTPPNLLERQPDDHGINVKVCNRCGADATNYMVCPACCSRDLEYVDGA